MRGFRRFALLFLCLALLLPCICAYAAPKAQKATQAVLAPPPETSAQAAVLLDPTQGVLLAEKNADARLPMASTTKIMTALVVLESLPLDLLVEIPSEAVGIEGSSVYLFQGEKMTVETLLYALLLSSANDAATALALQVAGSIEDFAARMNRRAEALGLSSTHFENPHGLPHDNHYTTARELALITAEAMKNSTFRRIVSTKRHSVPQIGTGASRLFVNHNRLLSSCEGAVGVKTGFTRASGRCLVSACLREGLLLIAVTLNAPNDWRDHKALYDWGFGAYESFSTSSESLELPVVGGTEKAVTLLPQRVLTMTLPRDHGEITVTVQAPRFLFGGFEKGEAKGELVYRMDGRVIAEIPLITQSGVPSVTAQRHLFSRLKELIKG